MADFATGGQTLGPVISTLSAYGVGDSAQSMGPSTGSSGNLVVANDASFHPLQLPAPYLVRTLWWANGSAVAGNIDVGIYTVAGTRIASAGATAQAGTNVVQSVALGTPVLLSPGSYYLAMSMSNIATAKLIRTGLTNGIPINRLVGTLKMASASPLPATATFVTTDTASVFLFGIARQTTI